MTIQAADRLSEIGEYYFSQKLEQIRAMNSQGLDIINLGIGSPDLAPSQATIETAMHELSDKKNHGYATQRGTPELRRALANWYLKTYQVKLNSECEVLPLLGSKEGLFYISMAFLNPGDKVLVPNPGYPAYGAAAKLAGALPLFYDLREENIWWPDLEKLAELDLSKVKLMWVNYPHMPSGSQGSPKLFRELLAFGKKHQILICHDNPYSLVLNQEAPLSFLSFDSEKENCLELNSFSKAFNMAGWRVGTLMASKTLVDIVLRVKSQVDSGMFLPIQKAAGQALENSQEWHDVRNQVYFSRRARVYKIFDKLGCKYNQNQVGLFVWAKIPDSVSSAQDWSEQILNQSRVFLTPGFIFGSNGERYLRSSLCAPEERLQEAFKRLEQLA